MILFKFVLLLFLFVQISYWIFFIINILSIKYFRNIKIDYPKVTIVICFKNEIKNIKKNFRSWNEVLRPEDQLIMVNDFSEDGSSEYVEGLIKDLPNVQLISATKNITGKKAALSEGVSNAHNDWIYVTDADCSLPKNLLEILFAHFHQNANFVLAHAPFFKKTGFLNAFQRFENLLTAIQYFSYAKAGFPYMGVGRNMLYRKAIFDPDHLHPEIPSGDDDLLVSSKANGANVSLCLEPKSFVFSEAEPNLKSYLNQKTRHVGSSRYYKKGIQFSLALFASSHMILIFGLILFAFFEPFNGLLYLAIYLFVKSIFHFILGQKFREKDLWIYTILLEFSLPIYYLTLFFRSLKERPGIWK